MTDSSFSRGLIEKWISPQTLPFHNILADGLLTQKSEERLPRHRILDYSQKFPQVQRQVYMCQQANHHADIQPEQFTPMLKGMDLQPYLLVELFQS
jgi:hypothetical protein